MLPMNTGELKLFLRTQKKKIIIKKSFSDSNKIPAECGVSESS